MGTPIIRIVLASGLSLVLSISVALAAKKDSTSKDASGARQVAKQVDDAILAELQQAKVPVASLCSDNDFLRRASLDITGQLPTPQEVAAFAQDSSPDKRAALIDRLIASPAFGQNWARYWRDVIYIRATEQRSRINQMQFESWMADQWNKGTGWDATVTSLLTASGDVEEHPETALILAQGAVAEEVAAESSRIFLGIQIQCANCHDHPSDIWKREQFHQLAAYFPRMSERRMNGDKLSIEILSVNTDRSPGDFMHRNPEMFVAHLDRNGDHKLSKEELLAGPAMKGRRKAGPMMEGAKEFKPNGQQVERLIGYADANKDGLLSVEEIKKMPAPNNQRRGHTEHLMVDLKHPAEEGKVIDPKFFVDGSTLARGKTDDERRRAIAAAFTSAENPWFARAIVNRIWAEMLGEGFYMPVDDMGPSRAARYPEVLEMICRGFVANGDDPRWLVRTVANTACYQRKIQPKSESENALPFASATPVPLRSDVIFSSLLQVFGVNEHEMMGGRRPNRSEKSAGQKDEMKKEEMETASAEMKPTAEKPQTYQRPGPRMMFDSLFGVDPSVPKDEVSGTIPQSLLMMNSTRFRAGMSAWGNTRLSRILRDQRDNNEAIKDVFLLVLAREPSDRERDFCVAYIADVKDRPEAFEDIMWTLLNSSEFISRR